MIGIVVGIGDDVVVGVGVIVVGRGVVVVVIVVAEAAQPQMAAPSSFDEYSAPQLVVESVVEENGSDIDHSGPKFDHFDHCGQNFDHFGVVVAVI